MAAKHVRPVLEFRAYGIAIHFVLHFKDGDPSDNSLDSERDLKSESNFESLERDLLSSVNRELRLSKGGTRRLFGSRSLDPPEGWKYIELKYPGRLRYAAEGKTDPVFPPQPRDQQFVGEWKNDELNTMGERCRRFRFLPSLTEFRSGIAVLHLVLAPIFDDQRRLDPRSVVNEWDLIVLSKLWQGGEGVGPTDKHSLVHSVVFGLPGRTDSAPKTINELAQHVLKHANPAYNKSRSYRESRDEDDPLAFEPRAGTLELTLDLGDNTDAVLKWLAELGDPNSHASVASFTGPHSDGLSALVAVEGVLCGLLDYFDIEDDEIEDVFADPIMADDGTFLDIHNGTMLMLAKKIRRIESPDRQHDVGVNPYLLLPQAVLLHNEYLLRRANLLANEKVSIRPNRIHELQPAESEIREALQQHRLPNIFHYRTERRWYDGGHQARGINDLQRVVEQQLAYIDGLLDRLRAENERTNALMFGLLGTFIAAVALLGNWEPLEKLIGAAHALIWLGIVGIVVTPPLAFIVWKRVHR